MMLTLLLLFVPCYSGPTDYDSAVKYCKQDGRYLVVPSSNHEVQVYTSECITLNDSASQDQYNIGCYVGIYTYGDNTEWKSVDPYITVQKDVLHSWWCPGYPKLSLLLNNKTAAWIDMQQNCLKNSYSLTKYRWGVCSIKKNPTSKLYWIAYFYYPVLIFCVVVIYFMCSFMYLYYHLFKRQHNWLNEPTKSIKKTAVIVPLLFAFGAFSIIIYSSIKYKTWKVLHVMPTDTLLYGEYSIPRPITNYISLGFLYLGCLMYLIAIPMGYFHILLKLQWLYQHNEFAVKAIPSCCKSETYFYVFMKTIIGFIFIFQLLACSTIYGFGWPDLWSDHATILIVGLWVFSVIFTNVILLYFYVRGLQIYSIEYYFYRSQLISAINDIHNSNSRTIDDRIHELLLKISRHVTIFGLFVIVNLLIYIIGVVIYTTMISSIGNEETNIQNMLIITVMAIKESLFVESIVLSWEFSHTRYEKECACLNKWMVHICHNYAKKVQNKTIDQLKIYEQIIDSGTIQMTQNED